MLQALAIAQLVLYIALLALVGQGALYLLTGVGREGNVFYRLLRSVGSPFKWLVRRVAPKRLADRHVPVLTFGLVFVAYVAVTLERIALCVQSGMQGCR
jgi:hypothetical protein